MRKSKLNNGDIQTKIKDFMDMISPSIIKFNTDHYICGSTYRSVWAIREYPTKTEEQAILRHLGEKEGVTLKIYKRKVTPIEERKIIQNATNKNRMDSSNTNDLRQSITAEHNLEDVANLISTMHRNREILLHCAIYIEIIASDYNKLKDIQTEVLTELIRSRLNVDKLFLRQKEGFLSVMPTGKDMFGSQYERVLPLSSVANLFPFNYSGKTDSNGFYIGRDKFGSNIIVDFDKRDSDKTNPCTLILGNSGQGKSYLLKLIICNVLEAGKNVIALDPENELEEMAENLGGYFVDFMTGKYIINPLEIKKFSEDTEEDKEAYITFKERAKLSGHISFLKDFFRAYKNFDDNHIDVIEIMLGKLYVKFGINWIGYT